MRPDSAPINTDDELTRRAERVDTKIREKISRPNWSVPRIWEEEGDANLFFVSIWSTLYGRYINERIKSAIIIDTQIIPMMRE